MLINPKFATLLARGGVYLESNDGNGNDLGGEADKIAAEKAAADKLKADAAQKEAEDKAAADKLKTGADNERKPSDEEAKLLKEVMKRKESETALKTEAEALKAKLKDFEGIDPVAVKKLLDAQKVADEKALEEKGEWDRLKVRMGEEHTAEKQKLLDQIATLQGELGNKDSRINEMTVGGSFANSEFISKELTLTPSKARVIYGGHFELGEDGTVTGFDKPKGAANRTALVDSLGNPVAFDVALRKIVEADADAEHLIKAGVRPGAQSNNKNVQGKAKDEQVEKSGLDKIQGGLAALMAQPNK